MNKGGYIKDTEYRVATGVKTCEECSSVTIGIGDTIKQFSLENNKTEFKWSEF